MVCKIARDGGLLERRERILECGSRQRGFTNPFIHLSRSLLSYFVTGSSLRPGLFLQDHPSPQACIPVIRFGTKNSVFSLSPLSNVSGLSPNLLRIYPTPPPAYSLSFSSLVLFPSTVSTSFRLSTLSRPSTLPSIDTCAWWTQRLGSLGV